MQWKDKDILNKADACFKSAWQLGSRFLRILLQPMFADCGIVQIHYEYSIGCSEVWWTLWACCINISIFYQANLVILKNNK